MIPLRELRKFINQTEGRHERDENILPAITALSEAAFFIYET